MTLFLAPMIVVKEKVDCIYYYMLGAAYTLTQCNIICPCAQAFDHWSILQRQKAFTVTTVLYVG